MWRERMGERSAAASPGWEDAKFAVQEIGGWVKNADTKITILAATIGVTVTLLLARLGDVLGVVRQYRGTGRDVVLVAGAIALLCIALAVVFAVRALIPRVNAVRVSRSANRFSWPELAEDADSTVPDPSSAGQEAWAQARTLSRIASAKYRNFKWSLGFYLAGAIALMMSLGAASWIAPG